MPWWFESPPRVRPSETRLSCKYALGCSKWTLGRLWHPPLNNQNITQAQMRSLRAKATIDHRQVLSPLPQGKHIQQKQLIFLRVAIEDYPLHVQFPEGVTN